MFIDIPDHQSSNGSPYPSCASLSKPETEVSYDPLFKNGQGLPRFDICIRISNTWFERLVDWELRRYKTIKFSPSKVSNCEVVHFQHQSVRHHETMKHSNTFDSVFLFEWNRVVKWIVNNVKTRFHVPVSNHLTLCTCQPEWIRLPCLGTSIHYCTNTFLI